MIFNVKKFLKDRKFFKEHPQIKGQYKWYILCFLDDLVRLLSGIIAFPLFVLQKFVSFVIMVLEYAFQALLWITGLKQCQIIVNNKKRKLLNKMQKELDDARRNL